MPTSKNAAAKQKAKRSVVILVFEQAQMLDVAGPADVFALASELSGSREYEVTCASALGGLVVLSNGLSILTRAIGTIEFGSVDTLIIAGAERDGLTLALENGRLQSWVMGTAATARRVASVCVGSFALAHWGLLDGRKATSHWKTVELLQHNFPSIEVDKSAIFVRDGKFWTAGGVTTGIDMALAMVESDISKLLAGQVAAMLVMSARRLGNQAQYSSVLRAQTGRYAALIDWMDKNIGKPLDVAALARQANESERSFCRRFVAEVGQAPAQFVEGLRIDAAKQVLQGGGSVKAAAKRGGFSSSEHLARVFRKRLAMTPLEYRAQHTSKT